MRLLPNLQLIALTIILSVSFSARAQTFYSIKKSETVFVSLEDSKAYIYELYRLPENKGSGRRVIDELKKVGDGQYSGSISTLDIGSSSPSIQISKLGDKTNFESGIVLEEGKIKAYNRALNITSVSRNGFIIDSTIRSQHPTGYFNISEFEKKIHESTNLELPYHAYEIMTKPKLKAYSDSVLNAFNKTNTAYLAMKGKTHQMANLDLVNSFVELLSYRTFASNEPFVEEVNELANADPAKFLEVAKASKYENKIKMFNALTKKSRKYVLANGPENETNNELKNNNSKNSLKTGLMIGVPSVLIILGAIFLQTN